MYPTDLLPLLQRKSKLLVLLMKIAKHPIIITEGIRTYERQEELYAQGRSKPGNIVTNARGGQSYHQFGVAFDVAFIKNGNASWSEEHPWSKLGLVGELLGLEWGGRWKSLVDRPHFQLLKGYSLKDFQKGQVNYSLYK